MIGLLLYRSPITSIKHRPSLLLHFHCYQTKPSKSTELPSTVERGQKYECLAATVLERLGCFDISRNGGPDDKGIDILARMNSPPLPPDTAPSNSKEFYVLAQCKNYKTRVGPSVVREWEGALSRFDSTETLGLLVSNKGFTDKAIKSAMGSKYSIALMELELQTPKNMYEEEVAERDLSPHIIAGDDDGSKGILKGFVWNGNASILLDGFSSTNVYHINNNTGPEKSCSGNVVVGVFYCGNRIL